MENKQNRAIYVRYTSRKNGSVVLENGAPKDKCWVLLDKDNGNPELGFGYLWLFETSHEAWTFLMQQNSISAAATVCGTYHRTQITRDFLCMARFDFEPRIYKSYLKAFQRKG